MRISSSPFSRWARSGSVLAILGMLGAQSLSLIGGERRQGAPAGGGTQFVAARPQEAGSPSAASSGQTRIPVRLRRTALAVIGENPYQTIGAVAVDTVRDEIVVGGAHQGKIMVFDRLANTPPAAAMSEPKRMIAGEKAVVPRGCGVYVDPKTGEIYATSMDVEERMLVYGPGANGNIRPIRMLHTPIGTPSIAVDEQNEELFMPVQSPPAILVYRKLAQGREIPLRILEGKQTRLANPQGVAVDPQNGLLYVANNGFDADFLGGFGQIPTFSEPGNPYPVWNLRGSRGRARDAAPGSGRSEPASITVYPLKATGDTPPLRILGGPQTGFNMMTRIYLDRERQELYVANDIEHSILVFRASESGNTAPIRILKGPKAGLRNPSDIFVDTKNDELIVASPGNHSARVFPRTANGDVAPLRTIRSAPLGTLAPLLTGPGALGYDNKRDEILVPN